MASQDKLFPKETRSLLTPPPRDYTADENCAAECLLLLARSGGGFCLWSLSYSSNPAATKSSAPATASTTAGDVKKGHDSSPPSVKNFPHMCNVCGAGFQSHQALGGQKTLHRARPTTAAASIGDGSPSTTFSGSTNGKVHECSICHERFSSGYALGGHKRKHFEGIIGGGANKICKTSSNGSPGDKSGVTVEEDGGHASTTRDLDLNMPYTFL